jgi:hypothetical protein
MGGIQPLVLELTCRILFVSLPLDDDLRCSTNELINGFAI